MRLASGAGVGLALAVALAGCGLLPSAPPPVRLHDGPLPDFHLEGRISVKADSQSFSGGLVWSHQGAQDELLLSTPLGQGVAELRSGPDGVTLTDSDGRQHRDADAETLLARYLGLRLPLRGLRYWLDARPRPDAPFSVEAGPDGRPAALLQDGWRIDYGRYTSQEGRWLPGKLFASHGEQLEFRLVVDQWRLP